MILLPLLAYAASVATLERQWMRANDACRGGNVTATSPICRKRDALSRAIKRRGLCWTYSDDDVMPTEYRWHPCSQPRPVQ